jgi:hypothetical protein
MQEFKFGPFARFPAVVEIFNPPAAALALVEITGAQVLRKIVLRGKDNNLVAFSGKNRTPEMEKAIKNLCGGVLRELAMERACTIEARPSSLPLLRVALRVALAGPCGARMRSLPVASDRWVPY